jgi:hypothetical protein
MSTKAFDLQIFILLLDGLGVGEQADSASFGDAGAHSPGGPGKISRSVVNIYQGTEGNESVFSL